MNCVVCDRNPERMNSRIAQCSHLDCPHRKLEVLTPWDMHKLRTASEEQEEVIDLRQKRRHNATDGIEKREAKCRNCGSTDVRWRLQGGRWTLFSLTPGFEHRCGMDDIAKDFD